MGHVVLDHILRAWLDEAVLVEGLLPQSMRRADADRDHQWFWDGQEHVDPAKEATAQATCLQSHTTTHAYEFARQGRDWESELRQRAKEVALMNELGLSIAPPAAPAREPNTDEQDNEDQPAASAQAA
jgi:capsid protein